MPSTTRRIGATFLIPLFAALALLSVPAPAQAAVPSDPDDASRPVFYQPPAQLPASTGAVIRSEPTGFVLDPLNASGIVITSQRIMYTSTDRTGKPIAVTGTVITPKAPWIGRGTRPLVSYTPGTQGLADRCAPSRLLSFGAEYEEIFVAGLVARGYAVAITDYEGLGTPGVHSYMDRLSQGHAALDIARAARQLPGLGLSKSPVAIAGYSQGGGAAASAAELAASYAPELPIKGTLAGAVPADLRIVGKALDGSLYAEFLLFAVDGLAASYHVDLDGTLNAAGNKVAADVTRHCTFDLPSNAFRQLSTLTDSGEGFTGIAAKAPWNKIIDDQLIGTLKPNAPVRVTHSALDDVVPYAAGKGLAKRWCTQGANIVFSPNGFPTHVGGAVPSFVEEFAFLEARFAGVPQISNCWSV
ncbi:lipase family protein [Arthrobacter sp. NPDC090010]|uniref:lipase family protein n=1 Tax=Arthrobacter sp. NPDC090010 TaxID=3363942 RepID=UPI0038068613